VLKVLAIELLLRPTLVEFLFHIALQVLEKRLFDECLALESVALPNNINTISDGMFKGCSNLTSIAIPNGVQSIGEYAFSSCTALQNVTIPNSVTSIGNICISKLFCFKKV